jgi:hypothetical protein
LQSAPLFRSLFTYTVAPTVAILTPSPSDRGPAFVPPSIRISWSGTDDDGIFDSKKPVKYKFIMLTSNSEIPYSVAISNPDSVRRYYAPRNWAGWDSTSGDTTSIQFTGLVPTSKYCFVVVAFDEAGAYSPVFSLNGNMLNLSITYAALGGPTLTLYNEIFFFPYKSGSFPRQDQSQYWIELEVGAGQPITINWFGDVSPGVSVVGYQWSLDNDDVTNEATRPPDQEQTDLKHWSALSEATTQATVGPFTGIGNDREHFFYVKALDNNGLKSLGIVHMTAVQSTFAKPLVIVNDTRLLLDSVLPGGTCVKNPSGRWPTQAEEDTFLFAKGGFPWKCYPTGTLSSPGLFNGYAYDTVNTRLGRSEIRVPLATLGQYAHVIWLTDAFSAIQNGAGTQLVGSLTALRYMTSNGHSNSLAAYIQQGGNVWLTGSGIAYASTQFFNKTTNDPASGFGAGTTYMSVPPYNELIPGRMMYDIPHWQSEIKVAETANLTFFRDRGRYDSSAVGMPEMYAHLPAQMRPLSLATDPIPPLRDFSGFINTNNTKMEAEYISQPNFIQEDLDPNPLVENLQSTLDTLYSVRGVSLAGGITAPHNATMTVYRGHDTAKPIIMTGFSIWWFAREDCQQLVDAVLQYEWGLIKSAPNLAARAQRATAIAAPPAWSPPPVSRGAPATGAMVQGRVRDP